MQKLFPPLRADIVKALQDLPRALEAVMPLQPKHRRALPIAIEELSGRLTTERSLIKQAYWSAPRLTSAYIWYFLPWNILRLCRLLSTLDLPAPKPMPVRGKIMPRLFVDLGSGPLSLPIALWLAKPEWRKYEITVLCIDSAPHPLQIGQKLFYELAGADSPWRIVTARAQLEAAYHEIQKVEGIPWLITAANVCNEIKLRQGEEDRSHKIIENLRSALHAPDASLLIVEPGTRLGGKTIVSMREAALEHGLLPVSPCPHTQECPLDETRTWCHFTFDVHGSPTWLRDISTAAKLRKDALSLAFVLLSGAEQEEVNNQARIISAPFRVPSIMGEARYACCAQGLALLSNATALPSGALVRLKEHTGQDRVDAKSGAFILEHAEKIVELPKAIPTHRNLSVNKKPLAESKTFEKKEKKKPKISKKTAKKFWEK